MPKQWNYLASAPFQMRYLMVAGLLRRFQNILEIGSYKTPIFKFIDDDKKFILSLDPLMLEETQSARQASLALDYRCLSMPPFNGQPFALVILGLDLANTPKLKQLLTSAELVVIEFPEDAQWQRSRETFDQLMSEISLHMLLTLKLDLEGNNFEEFENPEEWPPRCARYIYVMSSKHRNAESLGEYSPFVAPLGPSSFSVETNNHNSWR